ncbi:MAG: hypothetical protein R6U98_07590 [Pirellulaceae bacterium]
MESRTTQAVLPLVRLAAEKVIRDRCNWARWCRANQPGRLTFSERCIHPL